eukprot:4912148-Pleurochrysis_carterae.AAC.6
MAAPKAATLSRIDSMAHVESGRAQRAIESAGAAGECSEFSFGRAFSVAGAAASSVESCSRAESSSPCIAVSVVRAESSSRWADSRAFRCAALHSAMGAPEACMSARERRAAASRASMSASMEGRGSTMRRPPLLLES